jgi:hypothetical protein
MTPDDKLEFYIHRFGSTLHPVDCKGCALSSEELDRVWDTTIDTDLDGTSPRREI